MARNKKNSVGLMQGRLTASKGRGIQFFPFENWKNEFESTRNIGFDEIEFIFDEEKYIDNPLWTKKGLNEINAITRSSDIKVKSICADYFMRKPLFGSNIKIVEKSVNILKKLILAARSVNANLIEIPLVDNSSLKSDLDMEIFMESILDCVAQAKKFNVVMGLETDLPPKKFLGLLRKIDSPQVMANYDTGNSASMGYNPEEEISLLKDYICNTHIKDREYKGGTVPLGEGDTDFDRVFKSLRKINYKQGFILQAARGPEGSEFQTVGKQLKFLNGYINEYLN